MTVKEQVLCMLEENKGSYISGEEMAGRLYASRNAVWKAICRLREEGHIIEAVTKKGYRLSEESGIFTAQSVSAKLDAALRDRLFIKVVASTGSTNSDLKAAAEQGAAAGTVLIAEEQTAGRGRLGRSFYSPKKTGLYMSVLLRPDLPAEDTLFITTSAAAAVSEAVDAIAGIETQIKWVNDIYLSGRKICGILTEASMDFEAGGLNYAVCGIGVNLTAEDFPEELRGIAGGIFGKNLDARAELAAEILTRFFRYYDALPKPDFLGEYRRRSLLIGKEIGFIRSGGEFYGTAVGIDERARLLVRLENGEVTALSSGEASLKKGGVVK